MRKRRSLAFGAACGVICAACMAAYGNQLESAVADERAEMLERFGGEQVEVRVATRDIAIGERLSDANSTSQLWLSALLPDQAVIDAGDVAGRSVTSPIFEGEGVCAQRFDETEEKPLQVPDGMCAVSVPADTLASVGGSVAPGALVDVYASSGSSTDLLAQSVLVLSTSASGQASASPAASSPLSWVTLAVAPDRVEEFVAAAQRTELYFTLPASGVRGSKEGGAQGEGGGSADADAKREEGSPGMSAGTAGTEGSAGAASTDGETLRADGKEGK